MCYYQNNFKILKNKSFALKFNAKKKENNAITNIMFDANVLKHAKC